MSLEEKSADAAAAAAAENEEGDGEGSSAIAAGIRRDVKPWLNLVDDLSNLTRDAEISVPQVCFVCVCVLWYRRVCTDLLECFLLWSVQLCLRCSNRDRR